MSEAARTEKLSQRKLGRRLDVVLMLLGMAFGIVLVGPGNLYFGNVQWLAGDARLAQIAFEHFWRSPLIQFPMTATPNLGVGWSTGLFQNGENQLVALVFRPFADHFQSGFQFQGLWIVSCFMVHPVVARRIFNEFKVSLSSQFVGALVMTLNPALFSRIGTMWHLQMAAHWLILVSILMYLRRASARRWALLTAVTISINIYISLIIVVVAVASIAESLRHEAPRKLSFTKVSQYLKRFAILGVGLIGSLWLFGFGTYLTGDNQPFGAGFFRLNVLSFFNPEAAQYGYLLGRASFFKKRIWIAEEAEGYAYLGLGVIATAVALCVYVVTRGFQVPQRLRFLLAAAALLFCIAVSNRVAVGGRDFLIPIPQVVAELRYVFRAAPRFAWLSMYVVVILGWVALSRLVDRFAKSSIALPVLVSVLLLQLVDVGPGVLQLRNTVSRSKGQMAPDLGESWGVVLEEHDRLLIVPSLDFYKDDLARDQLPWVDNLPLAQLAWLAALNNTRTNFAYCARPCEEAAERSTKEVRTELASGDLAEATIYVFSTRDEWQRSAELASTNGEIIDGLYVLIGPPLSGSRE